MLKRISLLDLLLALALGGLYLVGLRNQVLFHYLAEMFRISVAVAIFMLIWNVTRPRSMYQPLSEFSSQICLWSRRPVA